MMTQTTNFWIGISLLIFIIPLIFSPLTHDTYGLIKIGATHIFIFVLCMLWMIKLIHRRSAYLHLPVATVCLAIFIVHTSLSLLYAVNPFEGLEQIGIWFNFFVLVVLINVTITNERAVIYLLKTLFITALVAIGYSIWINKGIDLSALRTAYIGSFGHPTFFAEFLLPVIPIGLTLVLVEKDKLSKVFFFASSVFILFYLLLTKTRASWIGLFFCVCFTIVLNRKKLIRLCTKKNILMMCAVVLILLFVGYLFMPANMKVRVVQKIGKIINPAEGRYELFRHHTIVMRTIVWKNTVRMFLNHPVIGVGMGHFRLFYPRFRSIEDWDVYPRGIRFSKVHNEYLHIFVEGGLLGGIIFVTFLIMLLVGAYRLLKKENEQRTRIILSGIMVSLAAILANSLFSSPLRIPSSSLVFWLLVGLLSSLQAHKGRSVRIPSLLIIVVVPCLAFILLGNIKSLGASYEYKMGMNYIKMKRPAKAVERFEKSLTWIPYKSTRWFELGKLYQEMGMFDKALTAYQRGLMYDPFNVYFLNNLGTIYYRLGEFRQAENMFKKSIDIDASYIGAYYNLHATYNALGEETLAGRTLTKIEEVDPLFYADRLMREKQWEAARESLTAALFHHDDKAAVHKKLAITLFELNEQGEAIQRLDRAIQLDAYDWELHYLRGYYSLKNNDYVVMREHYQRALDKLLHERKKHFELIEYYSDQGFLTHVAQEAEVLDALKQKEFDMRSQICLYDAAEDRIGPFTDEFDALIKIGIYHVAVYKEIIDHLNRHYRYDSIRDCIQQITRDDTRKNDWEELLRQTVQIVAFKQSARDAEERGDIEKSIDYYEKVLVLNEHDRDASGNVIRLRTIQ